LRLQSVTLGDRKRLGRSVHLGHEVVGETKHLEAA
jgi:hypothetical protein